MGSALGRRQAAEKKERKTKEAKAKLNSKVPHLLFSLSFYSDIICGLKMSSYVFHIILNYTQIPNPVPVLSLSLSSLSLSLSGWLALASSYTPLHFWLVQCWLKSWQNANVSFRTTSHTHRGLHTHMRMCDMAAVRGCLVGCMLHARLPACTETRSA